MNRVGLNDVNLDQHDPAVQVAVLFERLGHVMEKVDNLGCKLDEQDAKRFMATAELEGRVEHIEKQITGFRWFITGLSAGGGVLGGVIASAVTKAFGG